MPKPSLLLERALRRVGEAMLIRGLLLGQRDELNYQPLGVLNRGTALRAAGTITRLEAIQGILRSETMSPRVAMDIGSHLGFFSLSLAQNGWFVYAVESNSHRLNLCYELGKKNKTKIVPINLRIDSSNVEYLPEADVTLCLSVWHHWVRRYGLEQATYILQVIARKTRRFLFFDAGEDEMNETYKLPYGTERASTFLLSYLRELHDFEILDLGKHQAISPPNAEGDRVVVLRTLFCLRKAES